MVTDNLFFYEICTGRAVTGKGKIFIRIFPHLMSVDISNLQFIIPEYQIPETG